MTSRLDDLFNLPPVDELETESAELETTFDVDVIQGELTTSDKINNALRAVSGLESSDNELDDIASKALGTYADLCLLGGNIQDAHAGRIYEAAAQMLAIALDARDRKLNRKLKTVDLQLRKLKLDNLQSPSAGQASGPGGAEFDRNELLKFIRDK